VLIRKMELMCVFLSSNNLGFALSCFRVEDWSSKKRKELVEFDRAQNAIDTAGHRKKR
jgi:hypothetical protein